MYGYKVLNEDQSSIYGPGKWVKNRPRSVRGELIPCERGIHYCRRDQLVGWLGPAIWRFEDMTPDETIDAGDKMVTRKGRIVEKCENWNETTARLFAADVTELALVHIPELHRGPFVASINAARGFARGEIARDEMDAWAAAWAAANAARAATRPAARAAAWAAARDAQTVILFDYLEGRRS